MSVTAHLAERRRQRRALVAALVATDVLTLGVALAGAGLFRLALDGVAPVTPLGWLDRHVTVSLLAIPVLLSLFWRGGCYEVNHCLAGSSDYAHVAHGVTYGVMLMLALSYFSGGEPLVSRSWLLLVWGISIFCVGLGRFIVRRVVRRLRQRGLFRTRVVIIGASSFGIALANQFRAVQGEGTDVVGFVDEYLPFGEPLLPGISVVGQPCDVLDGRLNDQVDEFILVPQALPHERLEEITRLIVSRDGPVLWMAVSSRDLLTHGVLVTQRGQVPLVAVQRARLSGLDMVLKRGLDICGAVGVLVVMAPFTLLALAVGYVAGKRPLFSSELICAPGGKATRLWLLALNVSDRLPIRGAPALLAVLTGRLSLVGPRPVRWHPGDRDQSGWVATSLPPGLTGPWRLSGPGASPNDQSLLDLAYVRTYSIWEDLRILLQSVRPGALLGRWEARLGLTASADPEDVRPTAGELWLRSLADIEEHGSPPEPRVPVGRRG
jgi:lipopolysaccharide/colanic/teichoic acid biosynthesis glycosyltransferase